MSVSVTDRVRRGGQTLHLLVREPDISRRLQTSVSEEQVREDGVTEEIRRAEESVNELQEH